MCDISIRQWSMLIIYWTAFWCWNAMWKCFRPLVCSTASGCRHCRPSSECLFRQQALRRQHRRCVAPRQKALRRQHRRCVAPATPATPAHSGSADLPAIENSPSAPGVRQPIGTRNSSEALTRLEYAILHPPPALATPRAPDPPDFSWRPFRRRNQQSSSGSGRVDPRDT